jgi:hypothetical protein
MERKIIIKRCEYMGEMTLSRLRLGTCEKKLGVDKRPLEVGKRENAGLLAMRTGNSQAIQGQRAYLMTWFGRDEAGEYLECGSLPPLYSNSLSS